MENDLLRDSQLLNQLYMQATLLLRLTKLWIITIIIFKQKGKKRSHHNPTGFGHKHVLKLLPQLWKSHSWASKPSCDHLKACLVKLCCLFVTLTASSSLDFRVPKCTQSKQTTAGFNGGKKSSFVLHPLLLSRKMRAATYFCGHTSNWKEKAEVFLFKK